MELSAWALRQTPWNVSLQNPVERWLHFIPKSSLIVPFCAAVLFNVLHAGYLFLSWLRYRKSYISFDKVVNPEETGLRLPLGSRTIVAFGLARVVGCLTLFTLSLVSLYHYLEGRDTPMLHLLFQCPELYIALTYLYCSTLSFLALSGRRATSATGRGNTALLFLIFCIYAYRDIWPLATRTEIPEDISEGRILWAKVIIIFGVAVLIPLFVPSYYISANPVDSSLSPNPEQTCSLFSYITYTYLDPIILLGHRYGKLEVEQLPPLCDVDASKNLMTWALPHLDSFKKENPRHLFFGLMRVFWKEYILMYISLATMALAGFVPPICIYHILNYMENGGVGDNMHPWFWITCFFFGVVSRGLGDQFYYFIATKTVAHADALLTELIFEHSLRIRLTGEDTDGDSGSSAQRNGFPDTASVAGDSAPKGNELETESNSGASSNTSASNSQSASTNISTKGKVTVSSSTPNPAPTPNAPKKDANLTGKINNLITSDLANIGSGRDFALVAVIIPFQIVLCSIFLYRLLGWSSFVGFVVMIALLPLPGYATKMLYDIKKTKMKRTDARVQSVTEVVNILRMIKLFGWEDHMAQRIKDSREQELISIWWLKFLQSATSVLNSLIPTITMLITYITYTAVMKQQLTSSVIFSSLTVFGTLRGQLQRISWQINTVMQAKVSLDRVNSFLRETELLDQFTSNEPENNILNGADFDREVVGFNNATFSWSLSRHSLSRSYRLQVDNKLLFKSECLNVITGPTGCGKTSMLMALLGEMHFISNGPNSWFNLPREGGVAYAAQESWVQNETIKSNILFGSPYDEARYRKVLDQCALNKDLELFEAGDNTEVGERGITLSGGQKARLTLARAIYSPAKILLLDDVLAALDVHTAASVVEKCFKGELIRGRTVLLVTHNIALVSPLASLIVCLGQNGTITSQTTDIQAAVNIDWYLSRQASQAMETSQDTTTSLSKQETTATGKLILAEESAMGHVTWKSIKLFLAGLGGDYPGTFFALWVGGFLAASCLRMGQNWFLGHWGSQYETHAPSEVSVSFYSSLYTCMVMITIVLANLSYALYITGSMRASRTINTQLLDSILTSTLRWLDETPTARIITRFTQDIQMVDGAIAQGLLSLTAISVEMLVSLGAILIFTPLFLIPGTLIGGLVFYLGNMYLKSQLSAKREQSNARAPVVGHFSAAMTGIVSIRAYGAQASFKAEIMKRIDNYMRVSRVAYNLNRWISVRADVLGAIFTVGLAIYLVYGRSIGASNTGFSLNASSEYCSLIIWIVRIFNDFEVQSNSLERIQAYLDIDHEPKGSKEGKPPAAWPTSGDLVVKDLSARYSEDGPTILRGVSFHIESGQRVGVVGRTGSGKSTLTLALLRCILTEGMVYFDGIPTNKINLHDLRSNITIIPQSPELISGTLRRNLDPFDEHDDQTLNDALNSAGLFAVEDELGESRITLDTNITAAGSNLSVGERQILALARAMIRRSKLLILDEATSAIDYKTDAVIQTALRHKLDSDVTVITVAHRLQTIMDADKIMVLDDGNLVEFDAPKSLLTREGGLFKALVDGSQDKDALYAMVHSK